MRYDLIGLLPLWILFASLAALQLDQSIAVHLFLDVAGPCGWAVYVSWAEARHVPTGESHRLKVIYDRLRLASCCLSGMGLGLVGFWIVLHGFSFTLLVGSIFGATLTGLLLSLIFMREYMA